MTETTKDRKRILSREQFFATPDHVKHLMFLPRFNNFFLIFLEEEVGVFNSKLKNKRIFETRKQFAKNYHEIFIKLQENILKRRGKTWWTNIERELYFAYLYFKNANFEDDELFR